MSQLLPFLYTVQLVALEKPAHTETILPQYLFMTALNIKVISKTHLMLIKMNHIAQIGGSTCLDGRTDGRASLAVGTLIS